LSQLKKLLGDAAKSSRKAICFYGFLQRIETLFSRCLKRWAILNHKQEIILKPLSETPWEYRMDSANTVIFQMDNICEATENLRDSCEDSDILKDFDSVLKEVTVEFVLSLIVWFERLCRVNRINHL
jgi:hypothetical protein